MTTPRTDGRPYGLRNMTLLIVALEVFGGIAFFIAFSVLTGDPASACSWCSVNGVDLAVREVLVARDVQSAASWSHRLSMGLLPLLAIGGTVGPALLARGSRRFAAQDAAIFIAVFLWVTALADGVKKLTSRERPGFHFGEQLLTEAGKNPLERNLSFFSGDAAWAFAFASCGAAIAYLRGYRTAPWIAIVGGIGAAIAGALRVSANMHWPTDVLAGAFVGVLVGAGLPSLLHRRTAAVDPD